MPLTGLEIYKLLPQTNCKECNFPTCLAFAMKLAAKQATLKQCPHVTEAAQAKLEAASAPPIRLITLGVAGAKFEAGNETVLFRHEKTFYHRPGLFVRLRAQAGEAAVLAITGPSCAWTSASGSAPAAASTPLAPSAATPGCRGGARPAASPSS
jgi:acetyl-CoA decarbonylase/synthase complex subunit gamma